MPPFGDRFSMFLSLQLTLHLVPLAFDASHDIFLTEGVRSVCEIRLLKTPCTWTMKKVQSDYWVIRVVKNPIQGCACSVIVRLVITTTAYLLHALGDKKWKRALLVFSTFTPKARLTRPFYPKSMLLRFSLFLHFKLLIYLWRLAYYDGSSNSCEY